MGPNFLLKKGTKIFMIKLKKNRIERPLKLGFIGGSLSSTIGQTHYTASHLDGRWNLVSGFFSRNKLININTAKNWNISPNRTYDSLDKFLSKECNKLDAIAVLKASFPAGTVSGAPKVRAMEIIHELEPSKRGVYSGAVGYIGFGSENRRL